jgi:(1->4)-alpha-D-glucan 1-alpha-D-glucosylmutase
MTLPLSCYRLQLSADFRLDDARRALPYLDRLGVDHLYLSPVLTARPGSTHGYDVTGPGEVSPALGGERALRRLSEAARDRGMGILLDIVPNHMAADEHNPWWRDVLKFGPESRYARHFDIEWDAPGADRRLILPVLGKPLGEALADGELRVVEEEGEPRVAYHDRRFPVAPRTTEGGDDVTAVLERQHYRLEFWRDGLNRLNYRRFFDVSELAALRAEDERVFEDTHRLVLGLLADGVVQGFRVDHVDGLSLPRRYLGRLREAAGDAHIVVEKILARDERLPVEWPVHGTTGYDFLAVSGGLFVEPDGAKRIERAYVELTGRRTHFQASALAGKRDVLDGLFRPDVDRVVRAAKAAGLPSENLESAMRTLTMNLWVYRTYVEGGPAGRIDAERIRDAASYARDGEPEFVRTVDSIVATLLDPKGEQQLAFVHAWQQLTGPIAAKGVEDTALYRDARLLSRNEPGLEPDWLWSEPAEYAAWCADQVGRYPMTTTSTHDTKRGEDTRARITALSWMPAEWLAARDRWSAMNARLRRREDSPSAPEEWLLYQTLVGVWPPDPADRDDFAERITAYLRKALREAKRHTSWLDPDEEYEEAVIGFAEAILADEEFVADLDAFARRLAELGARVSLGQVVLKLFAPGCPDTYWGTELPQLTLVDPDNRRPIDFDRHGQLLAELERRHAEDPAELVAELAENPQDGRLKLLVTWACLQLRRRHPGLFRDGEHLVLQTTGPTIAVARRLGDEWAVAVVRRYGDTGEATVTLSDDAPARLRNQLTGEVVQGRGLRIRDLVGATSVAVLSS